MHLVNGEWFLRKIITHDFVGRKSESISDICSASSSSTRGTVHFMQGKEADSLPNEYYMDQLTDSY